MPAPKKKRRSASKDRAAGGGRTPVVEPRVQTFAMFSGCNFQLAPHSFDYIFGNDLEDQDGAQTDLMSVYMAVQNNARLAPNKTIETRDNLRTLFTAPSGATFAGDAVTLIGDELYAGMNGAAYGPVVELVSQKTGATEHPTSGFGVPPTTKFTVTLVKGTILTGLLLKGHKTSNDNPAYVAVQRVGGGQFATGTILNANIPGGTTPAEFTVTLSQVVPVDTTAVYEVFVDGDLHLVKATDNPYAGGAIDGEAGSDFYFAALGKVLYDQPIYHATLPADGAASVEVTDLVMAYDRDGSMDQDNTWTFLGHADDKLVAMTSGRQLWTGALSGNIAAAIENARVVPDPYAIAFGSLTAKGSLTLAEAQTSGCPFRVGITKTHLNKYGPTLPAPMLEFYASKPTSEWSSAAYVEVSGTVLDYYDITAVELYFTEGEAVEPAFLARVELPADPDTGTPKSWKYSWLGYTIDPNVWSIANLTIPSQNYTGGAPASQMATHDGRLYFWGGSPADRIWIGGNPGNRFSVSTGTGGGYVDCEPGIGMEVRRVMKFKTQQGAAIVTALCDNANSQQEARFNLVENNIAISNEQSVKGRQAERIAGTVGCKSAHGAVVAGDGLYAISRYGLAITTLTMEYNSQLQVEYVSDPIEPVFLKQHGHQLDVATLFCVNDVLYMTFGAEDATLDNVIFCFDLALKAWWTMTLDIDTPILNMFHVDYEGCQEGLGIVTADAIYLLPTTMPAALDTVPLHDVFIESADLAAVQPQQGWQWLSQLEFRFDYFIGDLVIDVDMVDQFGRHISVHKAVSHAQLVHGLAEYIRIDKVVASYRVALKGRANMRLTHFMAKSYPKSNRIGMVWGFDSRQDGTSTGSIQRTFASYNDLRAAILP